MEKVAKYGNKAVIRSDETDTIRTAYLLEEQWATGLWNEINLLYKSAAWSYNRVVTYLTSPNLAGAPSDFLNQEIDFLAGRLELIGKLDVELFRAAVESALTRNYWGQTEIGCSTCRFDDGNCKMMLDDSSKEGFDICARYEVDDMDRARKGREFRDLAGKIAIYVGIDLNCVLTAFGHIDKLSANNLLFFLLDAKDD